MSKDKLFSRITELDAYRYRDLKSIEEWSFLPDLDGAVGTCPPLLCDAPVVKLGERWSGRDRYVWMGASPKIPDSWAGRTVVGLFDFGTSGSGGNSGFESLLFIEGLPYQGVDSNHGEVFLPERSSDGSLALVFRLWSGLEGGGRPREQEHQLSRADLAWLDETVDDLYYTSRAILDTASSLREDSAEGILLLSLLDRGFRRIDWSLPGSDGFYDSVYRAHGEISQGLADMKKFSPITLYAVGHTHIDVAWLWRLKHTREKAARSFATALRLMERFPEYQFLQSQPQLYDYLKTDYPMLYQAVKERIADGQWEPDGAMWLEADTNLPSGESLVRQILFGTRFFEQEFGTRCRFLWLPDVFGYSAALPQILNSAGIDTFCTTKISWNRSNRMPHDTFYWRGLDGSEILTHFLTTPEPSSWDDPTRWLATYNGQFTAGTVLGTWRAYKDKELNQELLVAYGYGDGGGGVNREMLEMRRRLNRMPGLPNLVTGRADIYFDQLHQTMESVDPEVARWDGELYLEHHRGTYTSQANQKRTNRKLELLYRETEWLNVLAGVVAGSDYAQGQQELNGGWKILLRNQFHDIIPGSSIAEVYQDSREEYHQATTIAAKVRTHNLRSLWGTEHTSSSYRVLNSAGFVRSGVVRVSLEDEEVDFFDREGRPLPAQKVETGWWIWCSEVPALGWTTIFYKPRLTVPEGVALPFQLGDGELVTPYYRWRWNDSGHWTQLYDRVADRQVLASGELGNVLQVFEDKPVDSDAWNIDIFYQEKCRRVDHLERVELVSLGQVATVLRFHWSYARSTIVQDVTFYSQSPRIDMVTAVDWHEHQQLLKVAFPVAVRATEATYDIQFGNLKRPTHWNTSWDQAKFEVVGHQWADLSETGYGVSLANDCKYGYDVKDHTLRLSLIKSAMDPDPDADQGEHVFTYALLPHRGDWFTGATVGQSWDLNSPLSAERCGEDPTSFSLLGSAAENIQVDAVKCSEDGKRVVVRIHDFSGGRGTVALKGDLPIRSWQFANVLEQPTDPIEIRPLEFFIGPYEIKTLLIEFEGC